MEYHLNFHRLFYEKRDIKITQQMKNLEALGNVISPEHGFALYFLGYLNFKVNKKFKEIIDRLSVQLKTQITGNKGSNIWFICRRFKVSHLKMSLFPRVFMTTYISKKIFS